MNVKKIDCKLKEIVATIEKYEFISLKKKRLKLCEIHFC